MTGGTQREKRCFYASTYQTNEAGEGKTATVVPVIAGAGPRHIRKPNKGNMDSQVQQLAAKIHMTYDEFIGEMRKRSCSEATAAKIWNGIYEEHESFTDNDIFLSSLRKAADVLKVKTGMLLPK